MPLAETSLSSLMWLLLFAECGFRLSSVNTCIGRLNKHRGTSSVDRRESNLCVGAQSAFAVCYADASRVSLCQRCGLVGEVTVGGVGSADRRQDLDHMSGRLDGPTHNRGTQHGPPFYRRLISKNCTP